MDRSFLEIAQMLKEHPILGESDLYKAKYISVLEYFVRKYSENDLWAQAVLRLYIKKLMQDDGNYRYMDLDLKRQARDAIATKFRNFKFFSYRYCLIFDCILINAFRDKAKGQAILAELMEIYAKRHRKKLCQAFEFLYDPGTPVEEIEQIQYLKECWSKNRAFLSGNPIRVLITANMSAGKSTLLNALVGKKVNKTRNDACTAKIHYILNKPYEDDLNYEWDHLLELDADEETLMEDNHSNVSTEITVGTHFRTENAPSRRLWFIDTPGVNSSQDERHKQIAEDTIRSSNADLLIYLLNGENIGTDDDRRHLLFILENYHGKILFLVNKVDRFRKNEDSVRETLQAVVDDLTGIGFKAPLVMPVSAYAAYLAKMRLYGEMLDEDEQDEFDRMARKLQKEEYRFDTYYPETVRQAVRVDPSEASRQLLLHSGILQLEYIIYHIKR